MPAGLAPDLLLGWQVGVRLGTLGSRTRLELFVLVAYTGVLLQSAELTNSLQMQIIPVDRSHTGGRSQHAQHGRLPSLPCRA